MRAGKCNPTFEALAEVQFGLARALWDAGGTAERALKLARLALVSFQAQRSFQGQKNLKDAELWRREARRERDGVADSSTGLSRRR